LIRTRQILTDKNINYFGNIPTEEIEFSYIYEANIRGIDIARLGFDLTFYQDSDTACQLIKKYSEK
jgi:hypothetical protein